MLNHIKNMLLLFLLILTSFQSAPTCKKIELENLKNECHSALNTYKFSHTFELKREFFKYGGEKADFQHFLSKGNDYIVILKDQGSKTDKLAVEIFDSHHRMVASSYNLAHKKFYEKILFHCKSTETYLFKFSFPNKKPFCASGMLGFQSHSTKK